MRLTPTCLPEVNIVEPRVFEDERGYFFESFNEEAFNHALKTDFSFVQDNHSCSVIGVLRGLHYQLPPRAQGKLVRCVSGVIFDVAVDIRRGSPRFGEWVGVELSRGNRRQVWIPPGFAHGFLVLSEQAEVIYKTTDYYAPDCERSIIWNDSDIGIIWPDPGVRIVMSEKDKSAQTLSDSTTF